MALRGVGLGLRRLVAVHPFPGERPTYCILVAARGEADIVEVTLNLRSGPGTEYSPQFHAIRRELNLLRPFLDCN